MKGLEPSTFCMANASDRSHPFAPVRSNRPIAGFPVQVSEHDRTRANAETLPFLPRLPRPQDTGRTSAMSS
jgi:hypothetical protein